MNEGLDAVTDRLVKAGFFLEEAVEMLEKGMIGQVLRQQGGNQSLAAKALGIHRNTLLLVDKASALYFVPRSYNSGQDRNDTDHASTLAR